MSELFLLPQNHRINRVVNAVYQTPHATWDLDPLADTSCLSKFHFSRVFSHFMGEGPSEFIWRTRLERAVNALNNERSPSITETALESGFSSSEAFTRAFSKRFGLAPREFRRIVQADRHWVASPVRNRASPLGGLRMRIAAVPDHSSVQIVTQPQFRVIYLRRRGAYNVFKSGYNEISAGFSRLSDWADRHGLLTPDSTLIGIPHNSPRFTIADACLYDMCLTVNEDIPNDEPVDTQTIPGGRFAILRVNCPAPAILEYWNWLLREWLPASGETRAQTASFERYTLDQPSVDASNVSTEICLRLDPR